MTKGPCLCGDPYCSSCGDPSQEVEDAALERLDDVLYELRPTLVLYEIFAKIAKPLNDALQHAIDQAVAEQAADDHQYIMYLEDKIAQGKKEAQE